MIKSQTILFVCEHGAAKSILAAAYFNKLARGRLSHVRALAKGTHPDPDLSTKTVNGLLADGLIPSEQHPVMISTADMKDTFRIVTFCELPIEYQANMKVENWQDVPPVSEDYGLARDEILTRLHRLFDVIEEEG